MWPRFSKGYLEDDKPFVAVVKCTWCVNCLINIGSVGLRAASEGVTHLSKGLVSLPTISIIMVYIEQLF